MNEDDNEPEKKEKEIDKKKKSTEDTLENTINKLNDTELSPATNNKPLTAGFKTSRNNKPMLISSETFVKGGKFRVQ